MALVLFCVPPFYFSGWRKSYKRFLEDVKMILRDCTEMGRDERSVLGEQRSLEEGEFPLTSKEKGTKKDSK